MFGLFALMALSGTFAYAADETDREIARTYTIFYLHQKDYSSAMETLQEHLLADPEDSEGWNFLGLLNLESKKPAVAAEAFKKAAALAKTNLRGLYLYNQADALARAGDVKNAKVALQQAATESVVQASANDAIGKIRAGKPLPQVQINNPGTWKGSFAVQGGYDSNVLLFPTSVQATSVGTGSASPYLVPALQAGYRRDSGEKLLETNAVAAFTYMTKSTAQAFDNLYSSASVDWGDSPGLAKSVLTSFGDEAGLAYLNNNGFRFYDWSNTVRGRAIFWRTLSSQTELELPVVYQKFAVDIGDDPANDRSGVGVGPTLTHRHFFGANLVSAGFQYQKFFAKGVNYRANTFTLPVTYFRRNLLWGLNGTAGTEGSLINYTESTFGRRDKFMKFSVGLSQHFSGSWAMALDYSYRKNFSNIDAAQYDKHMVGLTVSYDLF